MYTFCKQERLCSKKLIDTLFQSGHRFMAYPYSVHWMLCPSGTLPGNIPAQVLIATSKKKFRHAVYRTHKPVLYQFLDSHGATLVLALNYIHNEIFDFHTLNHKYERLTLTLIEQITQHLDSPTQPQP